MSAAVGTLVPLAASLLDANHLSFVPLGTSLGRLAADLVGRLLGLPRERLSEIGEAASTIGGLCGLVLFLAIHLL
jgi:hypothetical protein